MAAALCAERLSDVAMTHAATPRRLVRAGNSSPPYTTRARSFPTIRRQSVRTSVRAECSGQRCPPQNAHGFDTAGDDIVLIEITTVPRAHAVFDTVKLDDKRPTNPKTARITSLVRLGVMI